MLVEDESGALIRIAGLFAWGFNIDSLAVGHAESDGQSRLTMVVEGDDQTLQQAIKAARQTRQRAAGADLTSSAVEN